MPIQGTFKTYVGKDKMARNWSLPGKYLTITKGDRVHVAQEEGQLVARKQSKVDGPYRGKWFAAVIKSTDVE